MKNTKSRFRKVVENDVNISEKTLKMEPKGFQYEPTWPQDGAKMASKSTILSSIRSFSRFSKTLKKPQENNWFFKVRGG